MENTPVMQTRIVGVFESRDHADNVAGLLTQSGIPREQIILSHVEAHHGVPGQVQLNESLFDGLKHFFHSLFDEADEEKIREACDRVLKKGNVIVSVDARDAEEARKIADFMSDAYPGKGRARPAGSPPEKSPPPHRQEPAHPAPPSSLVSGSLVFTDIFDRQAGEKEKH